MEKKDILPVSDSTNFKAIVENIRDGIIIIQDSQLVYCSKAFCSLVGYEKSDLLAGKSDFLSSENRIFLMKSFQERISGKEFPDYYEIEIITKNDEIIPVELSLNFIEFKGIPSVLGVVRDISKRKNAEKALQKSEQRFRLLVENFPAAIWITDINDSIVYVSLNIEEICGYTTEEIKKRGIEFWFSLIHPEEVSLVKGAYQRLFSEHKFMDIEYRIQRKDGQWSWVHGRTNTVADKDNYVMIYGIFIDITAEKKMEQQLRQSEKMQAIGALAGGIAHDFNNQLAGILGYADLLQEVAGNYPQFERFIQNIIIGVNRAADLTSQLLAFSRKGKYLSVPVEVNQIIVEVVNILKHSIDKRIVIKQELITTLLQTTGDPSQIQNAVLNCALNASDAMPEGGTLTFTSKIVSLDSEFCKKYPYEILPGEFVSIGISDTGRGIPEEIIPHIFEPFFSTKEYTKGAGMGLASVYGAVRNHNGAVHVTSTLEKGTTIQLFFSLSTDTVPHKEEIRDGKPVTGNVHILLVEDEDIICDVALEMMTRLGYKVSICRNGKEAVSFFSDNWEKIDLVILDMIMPEMDGKETFKKLREINKNVKVLISSGYSRDGAAQSLLDEGAAGFLQKPFRHSTLSREIEKVLRSGCSFFELPGQKD